MDEEKISSVLGLRPLSTITEEETVSNTAVVEVLDSPTELTNFSEDTEAAEENICDIEEARQNIKSIIKSGNDALSEMINIGKQTEQPRAFEVASSLMKTLLDANKELVDVSTKKRYAKEEIMRPKEAAQTNVTNNNLIVSTADLLKMLKGSDE